MHTESSEFGQGFDCPAGLEPRAGLGQVPLFHAAWLFAAGIAATQWLWLPPSLALLALGLVASLCLFASSQAQRVVWVPLAALWLLLGAWCAEMEPQPAPSSALVALSDGLLRTVEGAVVDAGPMRLEADRDAPDPAAATPMQIVDLRVADVEVVTDTEDAQEPASGGVRLTVRWPEASAEPSAGASAEASAGAGNASLHCGDRIRAIVKLAEPETYHDPGVWSREGYLLEQGVTVAATVNAAQLQRLQPSSSTPFSCRIGSWRRAASLRILALPNAMRRLPSPLRISPDDSAMLAAMITGDRTYLTRSLRSGFERTGSFHMLVVSGFHLAIVAGCLFWLARRLRLSRLPSTLLTIACAFAYALFTGFGTPVQRSLWMVTVYLLARLVYRQRSPLNTIGFAALCLLALSPRSLFDAGLQMTLLAVVAIAGIAAPLLQCSIHPYVAATRNLQLRATDSNRAPRLCQFRETLRLFAEAFEDTRFEKLAWRIVPFAVRSVLRLAELVVISCVVELAMTLPMAIYFHRITIFALPVNLLILPLLVVLMPAALVTLLTSLISPAAAAVPAVFVAIPLHIGVGLVHLFGSLALGDFRIPAPLLLQSAAFCFFLAASIAFAHGVGWRRRASWAALTFAALAAVFPRPLQHPRNALLVEAIDVGQGDSLLLITRDGKTLLIDGGGFGGDPHAAAREFDIGEEVVSEALWSRGIRRLDAVALTHAHSDHMGGLPAVLRNFHPAEFWVGNNPHFEAYDSLLAEAAGLHVRRRTLRAGDAFAFGDSQVAVKAPLLGYQPAAEPTNNDSLVLHVSYGATSVLLEGDAEAPVEQAMLSESGLESSLLKVGHHGSITSTRPEFLARVDPQWAVISCGLHNRYGHPRPEVLEALQNAHVRTFSTDIAGAVCFHLDGRTVKSDPYCGWQHEP